MTLVESDAVAILTRIRDSQGDIASQWAQAKLYLSRITAWEDYGGWASQQIKELSGRIDAKDKAGAGYSRNGGLGAQDITGLLYEILQSGVVA